MEHKSETPEQWVNEVIEDAMIGVIEKAGPADIKMIQSMTPEQVRAVYKLVELAISAGQQVAVGALTKVVADMERASSAIDLSNAHTTGQSVALELGRDVSQSYAISTMVSAVALRLGTQFSKREADLQKKVEGDLDAYIPGAALEDVKTSRHHVPDMFVRVNDNVVPVEIKLGNFDQKAVAQLRRYIDHYGASHGYAIGKKLTGKLDSDMTFVVASLN